MCSANLYRDTMAFHGELPWHQQGTHFEEEMTAQQALESAYLDYTVNKEQLFRLDPTDGTYSPMQAFATVNDYNNKVLGLVKGRYAVVQNRDCVSFFDEVQKETGARFMTAGAIGDGEKMWLMAKCPESFSPLLGDAVNRYILLINSHDGSTAITVRFTPIRVVCQNTLSMAIRSAKATVCIKHTENGKDRIQEAGKVLVAYNDFFAAANQRFEEFASFRINDEFMERFENVMFGKEDQMPEGPARIYRAKRLEMFQNNVMRGMGVDIPGVQGSAWHVYNAATEMADYDIPVRKNTDRTNSLLFGGLADFKQKAFDVVSKLVGV